MLRQVDNPEFDYPTALFREMEMTWWLEQAVVLGEVAEQPLVRAARSQCEAFFGGGGWCGAGRESKSAGV